MHESEKSDVIIVGFGPTGATLANLLAQVGLKVTIVEKEKEIFPLPRAVHFDDEVMRVFQTIGIANELNPLLQVNPGMRFVDKNGRLLLDWPRPSGISPQGWNSSFRFHQPDLEKLLRKSLYKMANVRTIIGSKVLSITQDKQGVTVELKNLTSGNFSKLTADYVVGCDGANSTTRGLMQIDMRDLGFRERWLVVDVVLKKNLSKLGDHTLQFCSSERPVTYCRSPGSRRRWEFAVLSNETDEEITRTELIWSLLSPWILPSDATIERTAIYTFQSAIAETWRKERVLLAGDAAHLTPPFMGQGMCAGIRDVSNLGWKLGLCIRDNAPLKLLDTYQQERIPHVRSYIETAVNLGKLVYSDRPDAILNKISEGISEKGRMSSIKPRLGKSILTSNVFQIDHDSGHLCAQPILKDGRKLDDLLGYKAVLLSREKVFSPLMDSFCLSDDPAIGVVLGDLDAEAVLVRPDRYIMAVAKKKKDVNKLVDLAGFIKSACLGN